MGDLADAGRAATTRGHDGSAFAREQARRLEPNAGRRAGHEAPRAAQSEVHGGLAYPGVATTIVLARHGETDWNRERRFQGHADVPLNDAGRAQAAQLAARLADEPFSSVYTSPLRRAAETAELVAARLGVEVRPHVALKEVDVGSWSGLSVQDVEARYPEEYARWLENRASGWHDGETWEELAARVVAGLHEIARGHPGEHVLAVTHGGPIRSARTVALGLSAHEIHPGMAPLTNCATYRIAVRDGNLEAVD